MSSIKDLSRQWRLVGEVDDVARAGGRTILEDEHPPRLHLVTVARLRVRGEVLRPRELEREGKPAPHHADAVDGVDQRLGVLDENVAGLVRDHARRLLRVRLFSSTRMPTSGSEDPRSCHREVTDQRGSG
jgi:hypothetical protein